MAKQIQYEKTQALATEAERALELIGRAIRMAGYQNIKSNNSSFGRNSSYPPIEIQKGNGYQRSDSLVIRHQLSDGIDFDCLGNVLTSERTKNDLALQGFLVNQQAGAAKGAKVNGGSLMCQSLDRQGRMQNTTLMNGINALRIEGLGAQSSLGQRSFRITLEMADGVMIQKAFERTFTTRNLP